MEERYKLPRVTEYVQNGKSYPQDSHRLASIPHEINVPKHLKSFAPLIMDYAKESDIPHILNMYQRELREGKGLSPFDIPTDELLHMVNNPHPHHIFVFRLNGKIIGHCSCVPSEYARSCKPRVADGMVMLDPEYAKMKLGTAIVGCFGRFGIELGYVASVSDAFASNPSAYIYIDKMGGHILGRIPFAGRVSNHGWTDTLITWTPYNTEYSRL